MKYSFKNTLSTDGVYLDLMSLLSREVKKSHEKRHYFTSLHTEMEDCVS